MSVLRADEVQVKFYAGVVVVQMLAAVVVDIAEDLLLHLMTEMGVVVVGPQEVLGEAPFQIYENLKMALQEVAEQMTSIHDDLNLRAMLQFLGEEEDLYDIDVMSPGTDGMMVKLNCLHGNSLDSLLMVEKEDPEEEQQAVILAHAYSVHVSQEVYLCFPLYHLLLVS